MLTLLDRSEYPLVTKHTWEIPLGTPALKIAKERQEQEEALINYQEFIFSDFV